MSENDDRPLRDVLREVEHADSLATPGPWTWKHDTEFAEDAEGNYKRDTDGAYIDVDVEGVFLELSPNVIEYAGCGSHAVSISENDAAFLALARVALPRLARELRAVEPLLRELAAMAVLTITMGKLESGRAYEYETGLMNQARALADELEAK